MVRRPAGESWRAEVCNSSCGYVLEFRSLIEQVFAADLSVWVRRPDTPVVLPTLVTMADERGVDPEMGPVEELAQGAVEWLLAQADTTEHGLVWRPVAGETQIDPTLYHGGAGIVLALLEAHQHFGQDRYREAAVRGARAIAEQVEREPYWSLYDGLTGMAVALHAVGTHLDDSVCERGSRRGLGRVREAFDGQRWGPFFELMAGNAGMALGALHTGDLDLAKLAVTPYLKTADPTRAGVNWAVRPGSARSHHMAQGTLGIVYALAAVSAATGREDLLATALAGAQDVIARNEAGPDGFLVPHSDPPHRPRADRALQLRLVQRSHR